MEKKFDFKKFLSNNAIIILIILLAPLRRLHDPELLYREKRQKPAAERRPLRFIIACGVSGCLITKGTDLSAGRQVGLAACFSAMLLQRC